MSYLNSSSTAPSSAWINSLTAVDIQKLGQSLRQIDPSWTQGSPTEVENRIWYQGSEYYFDIMAELIPGPPGEPDLPSTLVWLQITLRGRVLSWQASSNRIETGETEELDMPPPISYYAASKAIRPEATIDQAFVQLIQTILQSRPEDALLTEMAKVLAIAVGATLMAPD
ncbi:MAG: hypothetical protein HC922_11170 [Leptolyngbyaceae cyanobacterium SM2_3_12]|nr:hypothetical protein [Leptolyngbyaceae cyanobacterium SM2_3_12]